MKNNFKLKPVRCAACGYEMEGGIVVSNAHSLPAPGPGSICICGKCATVNRYTPSMTLEVLSSAETLKHVGAQNYVEILRAQEKITEIRNKQN